MDDFGQLTLEDLEEVFYLYTAYLNYGGGVRPHLNAVLQNPSTIAFKSTDDAGGITGVAIYTAGISLSGGHTALHQKIAELTRDAVVYTGDALFVAEAARNRRLAHRLNQLAKAEMRARVAAQSATGYVLHELWVHPDGNAPARRVVQSVYGISMDLGVCENFYVDFDRYGYLCPICKKNCVCSAQLVLSKL